MQKYKGPKGAYLQGLKDVLEDRQYFPSGVEEIVRAVALHEDLVNHLKAAVARLKEFGGVKVKYKIDLTSDLEKLISEAEGQ